MRNDFKSCKNITKFNKRKRKEKEKQQILIINTNNNVNNNKTIKRRKIQILI
jgi:hypothetical protein